MALKRFCVDYHSAYNRDVVLKDIMYAPSIEEARHFWNVVRRDDTVIKIRELSMD